MSERNTIRVAKDISEGMERIKADFAQSTIAANTQTVRLFAKNQHGIVDVTESLALMTDKVAAVQSGNLSGTEATLTAQAVALDVIFNELARRAAINMGEHLDATETYMRLALKAQNQCRATLQTLGELKNPRQVAFVNQANISHGHQQVNNHQACRRPPDESKFSTNKLTGEGNELPPNARASSTESSTYKKMETLGAIHRPQNARG
jgi:hypothetical protein